jgi:hypothetical protein
MTAPKPDANGQRVFNILGVGSGAASEGAMGTNGSFTIPEGFKLVITDWVGSYRGEGTVRLRKTSTSGPLVNQQYFAAAGEIQGDLKTPLQVSAPLGGGAVTMFLTQEGSFANSLFLSGVFQSIGG